jgi:uncharacterized protein
MPRRPTRTVPTVLVPGLGGSGPDHWQSWLAAELRAADREVDIVELPDADAPRLAPCLLALRASLAGRPDDGFDVLAHSFGAVLWLHHVASGQSSPRPARVALVAPPSPRAQVPQIAEFLPPPLDIDVVRHSADGTVLVGGEHDPYLPEGIAAAYGLPLKMATTVIAGAAHLNADDGHGPWPAVLDWCGRDNLAFIG